VEALAERVSQMVVAYINVQSKVQKSTDDFVASAPAAVVVSSVVDDEEPIDAEWCMACLEDLRPFTFQGPG
jgi:quinolinate synthase